MGLYNKIKYIVYIVIVVYIAKFFNSLYDVPPLPKLENTWWGPRTTGREDTSIRPFKIDVPEEVLTDLKRRLEQTRTFVPPLEGIQHQYGMNTNLLKEIVDFWKTKYDWRESEKFLNKYPHFKTSVQGLNIHFIHIKPTATENVRVLPLLLLHGWPGSIKEFYKIIPMLTTQRGDKDFVFEVIIPSLPGYGFSDAAVRPGLGAAQMAVLFNNLMKRIGFEKYYIQGGDWGATIVANMATLFPENILGMHSNMCTLKTTKSLIKLYLRSFIPILSTSKIYPLSDTFAFLVLESGYFHLQATKPDTMGVTLNDSPVGLLAYILEKFTTWTNPQWKRRLDGGLQLKYTYTDLLDNIMIYWVTGTITTSMRMYAETISSAQSSLGLSDYPIKVPSACAKFHNELYYQPDFILKDKYTYLVQSNDLEAGGHFAAFEEPKLLADDIWLAIEKFQSIQNNSEVLTDLKQRLNHARISTRPLEGIQQQYGMNTDLLKEIVEFWKTQYNWREREQFLNKYPQFKTNIQGLNIHYIHVKPKTTENVKVLPLLLLHGWPGSVREFYEIIPMLTTPRKNQNFVFEVIVPSLPGYGFSDGAIRPGLGTAPMATIFNNLMSRLGFQKYYVQGGDWGAIIGAALGTFYPDNVLGLHSNMCQSGSTSMAMLKLLIGQYIPSLVVDKEYENRVYPLSENIGNFVFLESGYTHIQATKPDTIGFVLNDSPVGLAAYIIEKFTTWTNPEWKTKLDGGLKMKYSYTDLLDNVMIYWITESITTSLRLYAEGMSTSAQKLMHYPVEIPTSCALFPNEVVHWPPSLIKYKHTQLVRATYMPTGGHFAAFEEASLLADDIWASMDAFQKIDKTTK